MEEDFLTVEQEASANDVIPSEGSQGQSFVDPDSKVAKDRATNLSAVSDMSRSDAMEVVASDDVVTKHFLKNEIAGGLSDPLEFLLSGFETEEEAKAVEDRINNRILKERDFKSSDEVYVEEVLALDNPEYTAHMQTYLRNMRIVEEEMKTAIEEVNGGTASDVFDFIDYYIIRHVPIGLFEDLVRQDESRGRELRELALTKDPAEFRKAIKAEIEQVRQEGVLTSENLFAMERLLDQAQNGGYDPMADFNQIMGIADLVGVGIGVKGALRGATKAANPVQSAASMGGTRASNGVLNRLLKNNKDVTDDGTIASSMSGNVLDPNNYEFRPTEVAFEGQLLDNAVLNRLNELNNSGHFGRVVSQEKIQEEANRITRSVTNNKNNGLVDSTIQRQDFDNYIVNVTLGNNNTGLPFTTEAAARKRAQKIKGPRAATVEEIGENQWVVRVQERIDTSNLVDPINFEAYSMSRVQNFFGRYLGASGNREERRLSSLADMSEATISGLVQDLLPNYSRAFGRISSRDVDSLDNTISYYRDGAGAAQRTAPNWSDFATRFELLNGYQPSDKVKAAYFAWKDLTDSAWYLKANEILKRKVTDGQIVARVDVDEDRVVKATSVESLAKDDWVLDVRTGRSVLPENLPKGAKVYSAVDGPYKGFDKLTGIEDTRLLEHTDVLGYNFGGSRINPNARWFVGSTSESTLASGKPFTTRFKSILSAFSEKQGRKAVDQINNITRAVRRAMDDLGVDTISALKRTAHQADIENVLRKNNEWNPDLEDIDSLVAFQTRTGFDFNQEVMLRARDTRVSPEEAGLDSSLTDFTYGQVHALGNKASPRMDDVLMEYGGVANANPNPIQSVADQFNNAAFHFAHNAYTTNALNGWLARARAAGAEIPQNPSRFAQFMDTKLDNVKGQMGARLQEQRDIISRRLNLNTEFKARWNRAVNGITEFVFDNLKIKWDLTQTDPSKRLLQVGFYTKFGFFDPSQILLQSFHSFTIAAASPVAGAQAAWMTGPLRVALMARAGPKLFSKRLGKVFGKTIGMTDKDLQDLYNNIERSGVLNLGNQLLEIGYENSFVKSSLLRRAMDFGTLPFKEGERYSHLVARVTSFIEFKKKFPDIDPNSDRGLAWIATRSSDLTFRMTTTNRAVFQTGLGKVPFQWLSYSMRAMEAVVLGRGFTPAERFRMGMVLFPMYGMLGLGIGSFAEDTAEYFGVESDLTFTFAKYGLMDAMLKYYFDADTAVANRLSSIQGLQDFIESVFSDSIPAKLFGPSGEIAGDMLHHFGYAIQAMFNGHTELAYTDLRQAARQISSFDRAIRASEILNNQSYYTKSGELITHGLNDTDAIMSMLGIPLQETNEFYNAKEVIYNEGTRFKEFKKYVDSKVNLIAETFLSAETEADTERALRLAVSLSTLIDESRFSTERKQQLHRAILDQTVNKWPDIMRNLVRAGQEAHAIRLGKFIGNQELREAN